MTIETQQTIKTWLAGLPSCPYETRRYLPRIPGIYFFLKGDECLYVGYATCIQERCNSHNAVKRMSDREGLRVAFIPQCRARWDGYPLEQVFIYVLDPPINEYLNHNQIDWHSEHAFRSLTGVKIYGIGDLARENPRKRMPGRPPKASKNGHKK
jgi:hypothetical protein